ncbi:hypothetical protein L873DRAFT_1801779 [Choiromyces venosus 120613-1]|uniref:Uncharacterized protein n=1 Tax=Choiromyces venosus 120613-1 TaxID=1336337 RepID=A0A3N4JWL9_9PEZI|nr:hypothetical protein L873DRAFT_1801779 [Choiromyces venosus 120613-1]
MRFTLQECLWAHPDLFDGAHSTIAETCLSYLNSRQVKALSTSPSPNLKGTPFLEYSLYWGTHAKRDLSDCAKLFALEPFDNYTNHISTKIPFKAEKPYCNAVGFDKPSFFSGLHCASYYFRIVEIVAGLAEVEDCDITQRDCSDNAPLVWAATRCHELRDQKNQ